VKPWCFLVLGRGVSKDFLVAWWRRSNRPPPDSRLPSCFRCRVRVGVEAAGSSLFLGPVVLQWLHGFGKRKVEVWSVWFWVPDRASSSCWSFNLLREDFFIGSHSLPLSGRLIGLSILIACSPATTPEKGAC
jgi:hypothetical protein